MHKTILITGSTDGIGLATAKALVLQGHQVLLHGRNRAKVEAVEKMLLALQGGGSVESYIADLSHSDEVRGLLKAVADKHSRLDVLINNAGVFKTSDSTTKEGLDVRFVVNTIAPYLLTQLLMPLFGPSSRVVNLSSGAQASVDLEAFVGNKMLSDSEAYAQSKLALTMWSRHLALISRESGPSVVSVNPASFLGSKMVKEAYGVAGKDLGIGADILVRAAISEEFSDASGKYFDNDIGEFASPHPDALDSKKCEKIVRAIESLLADRY